MEVPLGPMKKYSVRYCTVLYCTVVLYSTMLWSQFYCCNTETILMTDVETKVFTAQRLHGDTHLTLLHLTRGDILLKRGGPGQIENDVDSFDFHGFKHEKFGRVGNSLNSPGHE